MRSLEWKTNRRKQVTKWKLGNVVFSMRVNGIFLFYGLGLGLGDVQNLVGSTQ